MKVVYCLDRGYIRPALCSILSLLNHLPAGAAPAEIFVVSLGIGRRDRKMIEECFNGSKANLRLVSADRFFSGLPPWIKSIHPGPAAFLRLALGVLLDESQQRVLYLDADTIIAGPLGELFDLDLGENSVAAVESCFNGRRAALGIHPSLGYFNSGILLIDLKRWRKDAVWERACQLMQTHRYPFVPSDQDVLNVLMKERWVRLHPRWNCTFTMFDRALESSVSSLQEIQEAIRSPGIIHFISGEKPWKLYCTNPFRDRYLEYDRRTRWGGKLVRPPPRIIQHIIRALGIRPYY